MDENNSNDGFSGHLRRCHLDESIYKEVEIDFSTMGFKELTELKKQLESKLSSLFNVLQNTFHATMETNLLTPDRFPRTDIDIIGIRMTRVKIIRLRNDYNQLLNILGEKLPDFLNLELKVDDNVTEIKNENSSKSKNSDIPFARVDQIDPEGPAYACGLRQNDLLISFGNIYIENFQNLSEITAMVSQNEKKKINLRVLRNRKKHEMDLIPSREWPGKGYLGCYISAL